MVWIGVWGCFAALMLSSWAHAQETKVEEQMNNKRVLIDFAAEDPVKWYAVNDGVMGGVSEGGMQRTEHATGIFSGDLSLENNGGFASVRAVIGRQDLSKYAGIEIRVRGDGRTYQLRVRTDDRLDGVAYRAEFQTTEDEWIVVKIPFADLLPTFRGRLLNGPELDTAQIAQIAFMLADKKPGKFVLEIGSVHAFLDVQE